MTRGDSPLPAGFAVVFDEQAVWLDEASVLGGSPRRLLRFSPAGALALEELRAGPLRSSAAVRLARRLTDAGVAHPVPPTPTARPDVTVVIPVRDRPAGLARGLTALGCDYPVVVVDDGSDDPSAIAAVAATRGARLIRRDRNGGPAAARNTGLAAVTTELVAFLDSDCITGPDWISALAAHLTDPTVAAVAPRIVAAVDRPTAAGRYSHACGALDLGSRPALVAPLTRVAYVPTAALLVRRTALAELTGPFDESLRVGEDVDLIWRLVAKGWRVRYDPSVQVGHDEPATWRGLLERRYRYGTSAGALARRHPAAMPPLVLTLGPAVAIVGALAGAPLLFGAGVSTTAVSTTRAVRRAGLPLPRALATTRTTLVQSWLGAGRYVTQCWLPALAVVAATPGRRRWRRRAALLALAIAPGLDRWHRHRSSLDVSRFVLATLADDIAYGAGVWAGSRRAGTSTALRPMFVRPTPRPVTGLEPHPAVSTPIREEFQ